MSKEWTAKWIGPEAGDEFHPVIFKDFYVDDPIKKATLYITGNGLFEAYVNGARVCDEYLTPLTCQPGMPLPYYEYDVTELMNCGPDSDANSVDIFLGDGQPLAVKAEFVIEVYKNKTMAADLSGESLEDLEEDLSVLLDDELLDEELAMDDVLAEDEELDPEEQEYKVELLAMEPEHLSKDLDESFDLEDFGELDGFLEKVIDVKEDPARPASKRRSAQFFTMDEEPEEQKTEAPQKEAEVPAAPQNPDNVSVSEDQDYELDIFDFEDWEDLDSEENMQDQPMEEKAVPKPDSNIEVAPYSITDEELEALFNDAPVEETPEQQPVSDVLTQEPEDEAAAFEEPAGSESFVVEPIMREPVMSESVMAGSVQDDELTEELLDGFDDSDLEEFIEEEAEVPSEPMLQTESLTAEEVAVELELEEALNEIIAEPDTEEFEAEAVPEEPAVEDFTEDIEAEPVPETVPEDEFTFDEAELDEFVDELAEGFLAEEIPAEEVPAEEIPAEAQELFEEPTEEIAVDAGVTLVGGLPFIVGDSAKPLVGESLTDAVDEIAAGEEKHLSEQGTLVGGLPLSQDAEAEQASEEVLKEWEDAAKTDTDTDASLVGGLPFDVKPKAEAFIGSGLTEAVDNVAKNEEQNIASEGELVGGLAITDEALENLPEEEESEVTLVGGLPFVVGGAEEPEPVFEESIADAVGGIAMDEGDHRPEQGTLVGGLPIPNAEETETIVVATDETWGYYASDIGSCGIGKGEVFNRLLWEDKENQEKPVLVLDLDLPVVPNNAIPIMIKDRLGVQGIHKTEDGAMVLDFGHSFTGFVTFNSALAKGTELKLEYSESAEEDSFTGEAKNTFVYVSDGVPEVVCPHFTYYTGRYVKVSGSDEVLDPDDFTACVLYADLDRTGFIETSNETINGQYGEVLWEQKRTSLELPEDCTEREVYSFAPGASYNMDIHRFLGTFLKDLKMQEDIQSRAENALTIWNLYMMYGSEKLLAENYDLMKKWVDETYAKDSERKETRYLYDFGSDYSDLPKTGAGTDPVFIGSAYYYENARLVGEAAKELGLDQDAFRYTRLARRIKQTVLEEYYTSTGRFALDSQAAYFAALRFGLYVDKDRITEALTERLEKDDNDVKCSLEESSYVCKTLAENGMPDLAYDLLLNEKLEDGSNVTEFLYAYMAGIRPIDPGFSKVRIAPVPDGRIRNCFSTYKSKYGDIISNWNIGEDGSLSFHFEIPEDVTAVIALPYYPVCAAGGNEITVKSGSYDYTYMPSKKLLPENKEEQE
ncbi:MAG: family 78 glycoside hydrolase catalytic domain [Parasporobacterium sp.]|nr:family 78 glycoside hydrolase catalytic domain [Parasporobacterium sp.]